MAINLTALRDSLMYANTASPDVLLQDCAVLAETDRAAELEQQRYSKLSAWSGGTAVLLFFVTLLIFILFQSPVGALGLLVMVGAIVLAVQFGNKARYHGRLNLPNYRYQLLQRLIPVLKRDMSGSSRLGVTLDLNPSDVRLKFKRETIYPGRQGWKIQYFDDPWLTLKGRFVDRSRFVLTVNQRHQLRSGKNVNGKMRVRPRFKGVDVQLVLHYPPDRYAALPSLKHLETAVKLPPQVILKKVQATPNSIQIKVKLPEQVAPSFVPASSNPTAQPSTFIAPHLRNQAEQRLETLLFQTITSMFLSAYQMLNLAHRLSGG